MLLTLSSPRLTCFSIDASSQMEVKAWCDAGAVKAVTVKVVHTIRRRQRRYRLTVHSIQSLLVLRVSPDVKTCPLNKNFL